MAKTLGPLLAAWLAACPAPLFAVQAQAPAAGVETLAQSWRGYVSGFPNPSQMPALKSLGVELSGGSQVESFTRVMARAGLSPEALRPDLTADQQAALVGAAAADYARRLSAQAEGLSDDAPLQAAILSGLGGEFVDLAAVSGLVPAEQRAPLAFGHSKVERLSALSEGALEDAVAARVARVSAAWSGKRGETLQAPTLASVFGQGGGDPAAWRLQRAAPSAPRQAADKVPAPRGRSVLGTVVSAPGKVLRSTLGFFDMIWNGIFPPALPKEHRVGPPNPGRRLSVVKDGDPVLVRPAAEVGPEEIPHLEFQRFLDDMVFTMKAAGGVGLAAPQVAKGIRVAVVRFRGEPLILINPRLTVLDSKASYHMEGCLSMPGECAFVPRPGRIKVDYVDRLGRAQSLTLSRFQAVIVQHELDHLDGILFTMRSARYLKKFGLNGARRLSEPSRVELARWLANLGPSERANLSGASRKMSEDFYDITEPGSLASSLREGLGLAGDEDVFKEVLAYHEIRISNDPPARKIERLKSWIKSTPHALFAYDDLATSELTGGGALQSALTAELPDLALLKNPYLRGPPFESPRTVAVKEQAKGKDEKIEFPTVEEAVEFSVLASKYGLSKTAEGYRLKFEDPQGSVYVTVKNPANALLLARAREASQAGSVLDLTLPPSPARGVAYDQDKPLSFGLESEMNVRENPNLVMDYRVYFKSEEEWLELSSEERIRIAREEEDQPHRKGDRFLKRLSSAPKELPVSLLSEGDGNCEMNGFVFDSFDKLKDFIGYINDRYGPSSLQGHVAYKNYDRVEGVAGWVVFEADAAQLKTLEKNYRRFLVDATVTPGKNLSHHSLGPLGEDDRKVFMRFEVRAIKGKSIGNPGNSRITYAPVFRDDIYPDGAKGHEFRQFHKRSAELLAAMDDFSAHMQQSGDLTAFKPFGAMKLIAGDLPSERARELGLKLDKRAWKKFFGRVGNYIDNKYPNIVKGGARTPERFFFPLRDWKNHPVVEGLGEPERSEVRARIEAAARSFMLAAAVVVDDYKKKDVDDAALGALQIAAARWGYETMLSDRLAAFRRRTLGATSSRGPPKLPQWPFVRSVAVVPSGSRILDELPFEGKTFPDGRKYTRYRMVKGLDARSQSYQKFVDSTLEVIYMSALPYGHINLRVGRRLYSLDYVEDAKLRDFNPARVGKGKTGFVYAVDSARIEEIQGELEKLYRNSGANNVPPFDAESPLLDIVRKKDGTLKFRSPFIMFANNKPVHAEIVEQNGEAFLKTSDGFLYPVAKKGEGYCTQSLACATSATYVMKKYFEISIDFRHGAKDLRDDLAQGNPKGRAPDAIIDY
ncbi:MAG: peptide deformylase [Elusimicrobia bacterium]|nr:peptide deformylase [Elusimicrobiota bacterium]